MSGTPRTDAMDIRMLDEQQNTRSLAYQEFCWQLERELADCRAMLKSWYEAASPYATAEALKEALAQRPEATTRDAEDAARYRWLRSEHAIGNGQPFIGVHNCGAFSQWTGAHADAIVDEAMKGVDSK